MNLFINLALNFLLNKSTYQTFLNFQKKETKKKHINSILAKRNTYGFINSL